VRPGGFAVVEPTMATLGATEAAYFQIGEVAYAVVAGVEADGLDRAARRLFDSLH
jgi:anti-sigma factor RsiW